MCWLVFLVLTTLYLAFRVSVHLQLQPARNCLRSSQVGSCLELAIPGKDIQESPVRFTVAWVIENLKNSPLSLVGTI